jgi:hypothetical protein
MSIEFGAAFGWLRLTQSSRFNRIGFTSDPLLCWYGSMYMYLSLRVYTCMSAHVQFLQCCFGVCREVIRVRVGVDWWFCWSASFASMVRADVYRPHTCISLCVRRFECIVWCFILDYSRSGSMFYRFLKIDKLCESGREICVANRGVTCRYCWDTRTRLQASRTNVKFQNRHDSVSRDQSDFVIASDHMYM